ncbi:amidohydrolase family protein, partial [Luminiphilus sp.]|nr:amidohydrolase family protein [Luminiphilus sp.]
SCGRFLYEQANRGGAQALARDAGRIEVGALADLVALDGEHTALRNRHEDELLDAWIFAADDRLVTDVWSAGRHVVQEGRHIRRDAISRAFNTVMDNLMSAR